MAFIEKTIREDWADDPTDPEPLLVEIEGERNSDETTGAMWSVWYAEISGEFFFLTCLIMEE
mgnify:CR=1 FL=1